MQGLQDALPVFNSVGRLSGRQRRPPGPRPLEQSINRAFDCCASPGLSFGSHFVLWFQIWASLGLALAAGAALTLAVLRHLSLSSMAAAIAAAAAACFVLALGYKVVTGQERLVFLHHALLAVAAAVIALRVMGRPILPYAEILVVCFGILLAVGRLGCLCAGCCHGRPHRWGVRYGDRHVEEGFSPALSGVRLVPVQLLESAWAGIAALACLAMIVNGALKGLALAAFLPIYAIGRFACEFLRGDPFRVWRGPLSEAQWLSIVLCTASLAAQATGLLPSNPVVLASGSLALAMMLISLLAPAFRQKLQPFHPRQIDAFAQAVRTEEAPDRITVHPVEPGWTFSRGWIEHDGRRCLHWTVSGVPGGRLNALANLLLHLERLPSDTPLRLRAGRTVNHILAFPAKEETG
jgi:hypothetical protein